MTDWADIHPPSRVRETPSLRLPAAASSAHQGSDADSTSIARGAASLPQAFAVPAVPITRVRPIAADSTSPEEAGILIMTIKYGKFMSRFQKTSLKKPVNNHHSQHVDLIRQFGSLPAS
jgi:hypothetical protein